jgi:hypothetical protein
MVTVTGAIEITVHGWDIAVACGRARPVPPGLAAVLLATAPLLVPSDVRPELFADPVPLHGPACPVTNSSPFSAAGRSAAIPRGPPGLHK